MTDTQTPAYQAATLLAQIENDSNVALLAKITAFTAELTEMLADLTFPPSYTSPARNSIQEIVSSMAYRRDSDLPARIKAYETQTTSPQPAAAPTYSPVAMTATSAPMA